MSFENFEGLLSDVASEPDSEVATQLRTWFGYDIARVDPDVFVRNSSGEMIDKLWLHLRIQSDAAQQADIYNAAMTLWHS